MVLILNHLLGIAAPWSRRGVCSLFSTQFQALSGKPVLIKTKDGHKGSFVRPGSGSDTTNDSIASVSNDPPIPCVAQVGLFNLSGEEGTMEFLVFGIFYSWKLLTWTTNGF
jgi:hypothetical protein